MPSYDSTARMPFKTGGKVIKTITAPLTHLRNWASARAFKKANKKGGTKKAEGGRIHKKLKKIGVISDQVKVGDIKKLLLSLKGKADGGKAFKKGGLASDKMKSEVKAAAKKKRDKLQARHKTPGGGLWNRPGPHKVDINRRTTEALLGKGKIQEKIIKFANKFDKPTYKKWRKQIVESQKKKGIGSGT